jgi:hypothetical protein
MKLQLVVTTPKALSARVHVLAPDGSTVKLFSIKPGSKTKRTVKLAAAGTHRLRFEHVAGGGSFEAKTARSLPKAAKVAKATFTSNAVGGFAQKSFLALPGTLLDVQVTALGSTPDTLVKQLVRPDATMQDVTFDVDVDGLSLVDVPLALAGSWTFRLSAFPQKGTEGQGPHRADPSGRGDERRRPAVTRSTRFSCPAARGLAIPGLRNSSSHQVTKELVMGIRSFVVGSFIACALVGRSRLARSRARSGRRDRAAARQIEEGARELLQDRVEAAEGRAQAHQGRSEGRHDHAGAGADPARAGGGDVLEPHRFARAVRDDELPDQGERVAADHGRDVPDGVSSPATAARSTSCKRRSPRRRRAS